MKREIKEKNYSKIKKKMSDCCRISDDDGKKISFKEHFEPTRIPHNAQIKKAVSELIVTLYISRDSLRSFN